MDLETKGCAQWLAGDLTGITWPSPGVERTGQEPVLLTCRSYREKIKADRASTRATSNLGNEDF